MKNLNSIKGVNIMDEMTYKEAAEIMRVVIYGAPEDLQKIPCEKTKEAMEKAYYTLLEFEPS